MKKTILALLLSLGLLATLLAGCGSTPAAGAPDDATSTPPESTPAEDVSNPGEAEGPEPALETTITVGATPAPHAEILELVKDTLAAQGIGLEITVFNDYLVPNAALADGSLDANYFQHLPYLENYNAENGTDLVNAGGIHIEPLGIYPGRVATLEELADGAVIGIPNDPTNEARALALLETLGYISLNADAGLDAMPKDIIDNPKNLQFTELEAAQLPVTLPDLDFAVINGNYAVEAGLGDSVLATEGAESPYVNVVAVRNGDETRPEIEALLAALQSDEVRDFINEKYGGIVVPVF